MIIKGSFLKFTKVKHINEEEDTYPMGSIKQMDDLMKELVCTTLNNGCKQPILGYSPIFTVGTLTYIQLVCYNP